MGGVGLRPAPRDVSIGRVFRILESGVPFAECFSAEGNTGPLTRACRLRGFISRAVEASYRELDAVTLDDLIRDNCALQSLLTMVHTSRPVCAGA